MNRALRRDMPGKEEGRQSARHVPDQKAGLCWPYVQYMLHACHVQQLLAVLTMHARITQSHMTQQQTNVQHVHTWISGQLHHSCQEFCHAAPLVRHLLAVPCCLSVIASAILRLRQAFKRLVTRPVARSGGALALALASPVRIRVTFF